MHGTGNDATNTGNTLRLLGNGEEKLFAAHPHWTVLVKRTAGNALLTILLLAIGIVAKVKITTPADWVADRCVAEHLWDVGDSVFVVGRIVDARGRPVPNIKASFLNEAANGLWGILPNFYTTGADGGFHVCNAAFTAGTTIRIALTAPGRRPVTVDEELKPSLNAFLIRLPAAP